MTRRIDNPEDRTGEVQVVLFGSDPTPRIVAVSGPGKQDDGLVTVYTRSSDQTVTATVEPFQPFFFTAGRPPDIVTNEAKVRSLGGSGRFSHLVQCTSWSSYRRLLSAAGALNRTPEKDGGRTLEVRGAAQQYLMQTGRTCFKDMVPDDLHRLQLDIEVYGASGFPNARHADDRIILVALKDNRGWELVLDGRDLAEKDMLEQVFGAISDRDPDVIEGHNIYGFDLPYVLARCRRHRIKPALGRDGTVPRTFKSRRRFAERSVEYTVFDVTGRHIIDTYFLLLSYDVVRRDLPGYGLKSAAQYFGIASKDRTYVPGHAIAETWRTNPDQLVRYALDDVRETAGLAEILSGSDFYLTQIVPMNYGNVARLGPAAKIESLFIREHLRNQWALPQPEPGDVVAGGYTEVFLTGLAAPIVYADVESLYPSIMMNYEVRPSRDELDVFQRALRSLTRLRIETKRRMRGADDDVRRELDARQSSFKILINSFYGYLGFSQALFNDFSEADRVTRTGQTLLHQMIDEINRRGGTVVEVDTDGVLFVPPPRCTDEESEQSFLRELSRVMPQGIRIDLEGRYRKMLSYKKKNYALLGYDGKLTIKGSSFVARSMERFGRRFVQKSIRLLMREDVEGLHRHYISFRRRIQRHEWTSADEFSRTETLKDSLSGYLRDVDAGRRNRAPSYEVALRLAEVDGRPVTIGDRISYYIAGTSHSPLAYENARLADMWDPNKPDENTSYYLRRLDDFAEKFRLFFEPSAYRQIFSEEDLFGFNPDGIEVVTRALDRRDNSSD